MGLPQPIPLVTIEAYLQREEAAQERHEYLNGVVVAMSGGTRQHSQVKMNLYRELGNRLRGKDCEPYDNDYRISVQSQDCYFYPDASIICGEVEVDPHDKNAATNPTALFEVLSPSTEAHDRNNKMLIYRECSSLREYVLLHSERPLVEVFHRDDAGQWLHSAYNGIEETAVLPSLSMELPLASLYERVQFPTDPQRFHPFVLKEDESIYHVAKSAAHHS